MRFDFWRVRPFVEISGFKLILKRGGGEKPESQLTYRVTGNVWKHIRCYWRSTSKRKQSHVAFNHHAELACWRVTCQIYFLGLICWCSWMLRSWASAFLPYSLSKLAYEQSRPDIVTVTSDSNNALLPHKNDMILLLLILEFLKILDHMAGKTVNKQNLIFKLATFTVEFLKLWLLVLRNSSDLTRLFLHDSWYFVLCWDMLHSYNCKLNCYVQIKINWIFTWHETYSAYWWLFQSQIFNVVGRKKFIFSLSIKNWIS